MADFLNHFEMIRIINLPERTDRRHDMERELERVGLGGDKRVAFHQAHRAESAEPWRRPGERGVFTSHLQCLKEAAAAGKSLLILEDDADFTSDAATTTVSGDTEIFYGGYYASDPDNLDGSDIIGAHCMGFSADTCSKLVAYLTPLYDHESPPPIDGAYVWYRREFPDVKTQFAVPPVSMQRPSPSDIAAPKLLDRLPLVSKLMPVARSFKRKFLSGRFSFGLGEAVVIAVIGTAIALVIALIELNVLS